MRKHKRYPSQVRYDKQNPVLSFRVTHEELARINELAELAGKPVGTMVREQLGLYVKKARYKAMYSQGRSEGYGDARERFEVWYYCSVCCEPITIEPNSDAHTAMIELMRAKGWGHASCHEKPQNETE